MKGLQLLQGVEAHQIRPWAANAQVEGTELRERRKWGQILQGAVRNGEGLERSPATHYAGVAQSVAVQGEAPEMEEEAQPGDVPQWSIRLRLQVEPIHAQQPFGGAT